MNTRTLDSLSHASYRRNHRIALCGLWGDPVVLYVSDATMRKLAAFAHKAPDRRRKSSGKVRREDYP